MHTVEALKTRMRAGQWRGIAVDIDETLADSTAHWFNELYRFRPLLRMSLREAMAQYKFVEDVPEWRTPEAHAHIRHLLTSNEFQENIPLITGADSGVRALHERHFVAAYITARPEAVRAGTLSWLTQHQLPPATLIMRDEAVDLERHNEDKNSWKARILAELFPEINVVIDDNAGLISALDALDWRGTLYLFGPQQRPVEPRRGVVSCPTWTDVMASFRKHWGA